MSTIHRQDWNSRARALADQLSPAGTAWREAITRTPRHAFVPAYYTYEDGDYRAVTREDPGWLDDAYSDDSLVTQVAESAGGVRPVSSSPRPSLMLAMLEAL